MIPDFASMIYCGLKIPTIYGSTRSSLLTVGVTTQSSVVAVFSHIWRAFLRLATTTLAKSGMILRTSLISLLLLITGEGLFAHSPFTWSAGLGLDYASSESTSSYAEDRYDTFTKRVDLYFSSFFWNRDLLKYTLKMNLEETSIDNRASSGDTKMRGYGVDLFLFPSGRDNLELSLGRNTFDYVRTEGPDYSRTTDFLALRGNLRGWRGYFSTNRRRAPSLPEDERTDEDGYLRRSWTGKHGQINLDLRHTKQALDYFQSSFTQQSLHLYGNRRWSETNVLWADTTLYHFIYSDQNMDQQINQNFGTVVVNWNRSWSDRWESLTELHQLFSDQEQEGTEVKVIGRRRLRRSLRLEIQGGYFQNQSGDVTNAYPYYGGGLYYQKRMKQLWTITGEAGILLANKEGDLEKGRESRPYATFSAERVGPRHRLNIEINYDSLKGHIAAPTPEDITLGRTSYAALTRDNLLGKVQDTVALSENLSLRLLTLYQVFNETEKEREVRQTTLSQEVTLQVPKGSAGLRYVDASQEYHFNSESLTAWDLHASYSLNTHMKAKATYVERNKDLALMREKEQEIYLNFIYRVGKFSFQLWGEYLKTSYDAFEKDDRSVRFIVTRRFGNEGD